MKKFVIGVILGTLLAMTASVYADDGLEKIEAYIRKELPITLNGSKVQLESPPVMVDGSTYLKLRDVAKLTGLQVNWNESTQTVELGEVKGGSKMATEPATTDIQETEYKGTKAILYNGNTYFAVFQYNNEHKETAINFDVKTRTLSVKDKVISVDSADAGDFLIYKGDSYLNVQYYPESQPITP